MTRPRPSVLALVMPSSRSPSISGHQRSIVEASRAVSSVPASAQAVKNRVSEVGLVQASYANGKMTVNIRRLGAGEQPAKTSVDVPMLQTVGTTYPAAAQAAVRAMEDLWKTRSAIDFSQRGRLSADVRIAGLEQWGEIQTALGGISNVTGVTVTAMNINYARINLAYMGGVEQLREAMGAAGLTLTNRGGQWMLAKPQ